MWTRDNFPDYVAEYAKRQRRLIALRTNPGALMGAKEFYRERPHEFIMDWLETFDPRNASTRGGRPTKMPFIFFPRQHELVTFLLSCVKDEESGLIEKCRDMGATWVCCAFSVWLWLFWDGASIGWGSRKEQLVDRLGDADSIFEKIRMIVRSLPREFLPKGFTEKEHATFMKLINPENGASITGEAGDNIGRGGRKLIYFKDESAHYSRPELIEAALGDNTRTQIDISSVNGVGNVFYRRRQNGTVWSPGAEMPRDTTRVFVMDWRDHPDKDDEWYNRRRAKWEADGLLTVFKQEVDRDYASSVDGVIIDARWIRAAIDAHKVLNFKPGGNHIAGLDIADEGADRNALALRRGVVLTRCDHWGERDTGVTTRKAIGMCTGLGAYGVLVNYDAIGVGAGVKAEVNRLKDDKRLPGGIEFAPWIASASPLWAEKFVVPGDRQSPKNEDFFKNLKAQGWWLLARRFERTYRAVMAVKDPDNFEPFTYDEADLISLPSDLPRLREIEQELAQPTMGRATDLRLIVNKKPEGTRSPNLGDAIMMAYHPVKASGLSLEKLAKALS